MARTIQEIYDSMIAEKESGKYPSLQVLNSSSAVAIWRGVFWVVASAIAVLEQMWDLFKVEIDTAIANKISQTDRWLQAQALFFQDGYNVSIDEFFKPYYATIDEDARIVTVASATTEAYGVCKLKVAKGSAGAYEALTSLELSRFSDYVADIKGAGTKIDVISQSADLLKGTFNIYFDPSYLQSDIETRVGIAIDSFLSLLPFNGLLYKQRLVDAIQAVEGVADVVLSDLEVKPDGGTYAVLERKYSPISGYLAVDDANATFNYQSE